jgi:hypothetical protein
VLNYKYFNLNSAGDAPPWGPKETTAFTDIIDTIVSDTLGGVKKSTGHKHAKVYNGYSSAILDANNTDGTVDLGGDPNTECGQAFRFSVRDGSSTSYLVEGNNIAGEHVELFKMSYGSGVTSDLTTMGGGGTQRLDIRVRDLYANAFRLRVGTNDAINVNAAAGSVKTTIGSPGVTYPLTMMPDGDVYTRPWQEITTDCTFNGFLDLDPLNNHVWIRQVGGLVFVQFDVVGTSDNQFTSISFPFAMQGSCKLGSFYGFDSSGEFNVIGYYTDNTNTLYTRNYFGNNLFWQNVDPKGLSGSFVTSVVVPQFTIA